MTRLKHVWFDFAGTLYRELDDFNAAHDKLRYETYAKLAGQHDPEKARAEYEALYAKHGSNSATFRSLGQASDYWQKIFINKLNIYSFLQPDPVVTETLAALRKDVPVSIFTSYKSKEIVDLLDHLAIPREYFTHLLSGDDVSERKPSLVGFHKIVELSGVPAGQIMYVGDRLDVDIKPAKQAGMRTCLIYGQSPEADYCIASFAELKKVVESV